MSCKNKPYIIQTIKGGGGQGPVGPPGPPGSGIQLPIDSDDVLYRDQGTVQDIIDSLLYEPLVGNSFTVTPSVFELGSTVSSLGFNWSYNKAVTSQSIVGPQINASLAVGARSYANSALSLNSNSTFTLTASDGVNSINRVASISFLNKVRWGARADGTINSAFIDTLTGSVLSNAKSREFTVNALSGQYIWYAYPSRLGNAVFYAFGFEEVFTKTIVSYTNPQGYTENYNVYRNENPGQGQVTVSAI